jgi:hypothetical protein
MWKVNHVFAHRATTSGGRVTRLGGSVVTEGRSRRPARCACFFGGEYGPPARTVQTSPMDAHIVGLGKREVTACEFADLSNS